MAAGVRTIQDYYEIYKTEVISQAGDLTDFNPGSMHDILAGTFVIAINEVAELLISEFRKTYFDTAEGGDLDSLAADHFGNRFARPQALRSTVTLTFSRNNTNLGDIIIPRGTVVRTATDAFGTSISFVTLEQVKLVSESIHVSAQSEDRGATQNVGANTLIEIDSALKDPDINVKNTHPSAGGTDSQTDFEYRETIRSLIGSLVGATKDAIEGVLRSVPEIANVALVETLIPVISYDIATQKATEGAQYFTYNKPVAYVSDIYGNSSDELLVKARDAIKSSRAAGVIINVLGASTKLVTWQAKLTFNASSPNYSGISADPKKIKESMIDYVNRKLAIGESFSRDDARDFILSLWGGPGTNDLSDFKTELPSGDVSVKADEKLFIESVEIV